jgi:hypothetical protein
VFAFADAMLQHYILLQDVFSDQQRVAATTQGGAVPTSRVGTMAAWNHGSQLVPGLGTSD